MKSILKSVPGLVLVTIFIFSSCNTNTISEDVITLNYANNVTPGYYQVIEMYQQLANTFKEAKLIEYGTTDAGKPLHLFVISKNKDFKPESIKKDGKTILLINNGIHPGEPCGIDASLQFANDILLNKNNLKINLDNTVLCIIPVYNVGGALNRSHYHRTGHKSPKESGFRGNAKNLDLNRDFVKCDTKNAVTFTTIFHEWKPNVFLDTHTTNGSDHQYTQTLIAPQHNSMHPIHGKFLTDVMLPELYENMKKGDYEIIPYVKPFDPSSENSYDSSPKNGILSYIQTAKFSSGYTQLFNCLGFMTENHIYKSYYDRVMSAYDFINELLIFTNNHSDEIFENKKQVSEMISQQEDFNLTHTLDTTKYNYIEFKGYEAGMLKSTVTGVERYGYDLTKPYTQEIKYYDYYKPTLIIKKPAYYVIPQAWNEIIERFKLNKIEMKQLSKDTALTVEVYYIENFEDERRQNNGHRVHRNVEVKKDVQQINYYKGDYVVEVNQAWNRYIVEMLEPQAPDGFFAWNFFDPCLESREYFSSYGFEANALKYLNDHPVFKAEFEKKKQDDPEFAENHRAQLAYIYYNSEWNEVSYKRYPVTRINDNVALPIL
ncbi:MAG: hypothetical protein PF485_14655 [Bacteroidales bacterium]|jgi:hypothetical protein|nr:hypothetical protein [Bacteroidales bacterium]